MDDNTYTLNEIYFPFWFWIVIFITFICYSIGTYTFIKTIICIINVLQESSKTAMIDALRLCMTPSIITVILFLYIIAGYNWYSPIIQSALQYYLGNHTTVDDMKHNEGFLVGRSEKPGITKYVITRRQLLDNLRNYLSRLNLPYGIQCEPASKCSERHCSPQTAHLFLQRIKEQSPSIHTLPDGWEKTTEELVNNVCKEQCILQSIIQMMEVQSTIQYSFEQARERLKPLLDFYDTARVGNIRYKSRREVDDILGIPLGDIEPIKEVSMFGVNSLRPKNKASIHDSGDDPNKPNIENDIRLLYTTSTGDDLPLATQTNEVSLLDKLAHHSYPRGDLGKRAGNDDRKWSLPTNLPHYNLLSK